MSGRTNIPGKTATRPCAIRFCMLVLTAVIFCLSAQSAKAQAATSHRSGNAVVTAPAVEPPVMDRQIFTHFLFNELEGRAGGNGTALRWDDEGWIGTDMNRLWLKSEGFLRNGTVSDGDLEVFYDRPIPRLRYFDAQAGVRVDLDSGPRRTWGAVGIQGLAPHFFEIEPTFYFRDAGHVAGRLTATYDLLITQRLIAQPNLELNFYGKRDPQRGLGTGLSDLDTGIRLRYEISRKFAPYIGFAYTRKHGGTATLSRQAGEPVADPTFVFGLRVWY
jgi:copper resistance protein B